MHLVFTRMNSQWYKDNMQYWGDISLALAPHPYPRAPATTNQLTVRRIESYGIELE